MRFIIFSILLGLLVNLQTQAQNKGQLDGSAGINFGTFNDQPDHAISGYKALGVKFQLEYRLMERWSVNTSYSLAHNPSCYPYKFRNLNIGSKYYFLNKGIQAYGLVELRRLVVSDDSGKADCYYIQAPNHAVQESETGVNLGIGFRADVMKRFFVFAETKWTSLQGHRQLAYSGIGYRILK